MEIIESDLKQLFQWIKNHDRDFKTLDNAIVQLQEAYKVECSLMTTHQDAIKTLDARMTVLENSVEKLAIDINYFLDQEEKYLRDNK